MEDLAVGTRWKMIHGGTHSRAAWEAEQRGELPLTRAVEAVYKALECKKHKVSRRKVREFLLEHCHCGWHHVAGPGRAREIDYYATELTDKQKRQLLGAASEQLEAAI